MLILLNIKYKQNITIEYTCVIWGMWEEIHQSPIIKSMSHSLNICNDFLYNQSSFQCHFHLSTSFKPWLQFIYFL